MAKLYLLRLEAGFPAETRRRAGIELRRGERLTTALTDEQLEALQNDEWISVKEAGSTEGGDEESVTQDLKTLKRKDLNLIATELGLDPSEYKNVETLIPAIEEARLAKQNEGVNTPKGGSTADETTTPPAGGAPEGGDTTTPPANPEGGEGSDTTTPPANPDANVPNLNDKTVDELELIAAELNLNVEKVEDEAAYKAALVKAIEDAKPADEE